MEPKFKSSTYRPCSLCPEPVHCWLSLEATEQEPCWGQTMSVSDFAAEDKVHACEGHAECWGLVKDNKYKPEKWEQAHGI
jgi:hypothetical protein